MNTETDIKWLNLNDPYSDSDSRSRSLQYLIKIQDDRLPEFMVNSIEKENIRSSWMFILVSSLQSICFFDEDLQIRLKNRLLYIAKELLIVDKWSSTIIFALNGFFKLANEEEAISANLFFVENSFVLSEAMRGIRIVFGVGPPKNENIFFNAHNIWAEIVRSHINKWVLTTKNNINLIIQTLMALSITGYNNIEDLIKLVYSFNGSNPEVSFWILEQLERELLSIKFDWTFEFWDDGPVSSDNIFFIKLNNTLLILEDTLKKLKNKNSMDTLNG